MTNLQVLGLYLPLLPGIRIKLHQAHDYFGKNFNTCEILQDSFKKNIGGYGIKSEVFRYVDLNFLQCNIMSLIKRGLFLILPTCEKRNLTRFSVFLDIVKIKKLFR